MITITVREGLTPKVDVDFRPLSVINTPLGAQVQEAVRFLEGLFAGEDLAIVNMKDAVDVAAINPVHVPESMSADEANEKYGERYGIDWVYDAPQTPTDGPEGCPVGEPGAEGEDGAPTSPAAAETPAPTVPSIATLPGEYVPSPAAAPVAPVAEAPVAEAPAAEVEAPVTETPAVEVAQAEPEVAQATAEVAPEAAQDAPLVDQAGQELPVTTEATDADKPEAPATEEAAE
jgi:hypothetical protein